MKLALSTGLALLLAGAPAVAHPIHGGAYRGPGGTVPPAADTAGAAGSSGSSASASGSGAAGPAGPRGGVSAPGAPAPARPGTMASRGLPTASAQLDPTLWSVWWAFNKDAFLDLRRRVRAAPESAGWLGRGDAARLMGDQAPTEEQVRSEIQPALLAVLAQERQVDLVSGCLVALAKTGDPSPPGEPSTLEPVFVRFLADSNQEIRETAAVALGILARESSVPLLADLLHDAPRARRELVESDEVDYRTRAFAAYGLGLVGARSASESVRARIVGHLARAIELDATASSDLQVAAVISLGLVPIGKLGGQTDADGERPPESSRMAQLASVHRLVRDRSRDHLVRAHALTALVRLLDGLPVDHHRFWCERALGTTLALLDAEPPAPPTPNELVQSAVLALGELGERGEPGPGDAVRVRLERVLSGAVDQQARRFALIALARSSGPLPAAIGRSARPVELRGRVAAAGRTAELLQRTLRSGRDELRPWAGLAVGLLARAWRGAEERPEGLDRAVAALREALAEEKSKSDLGAYALAAGLLPDDAALELLRGHLASLREEDVRGYVALAIGMTGQRTALEPLRELLGEARHRPELLNRTAMALGLLGDKGAVPTLLDALRTSRTMMDQAAVAGALGMVGDRRCVAPLVAMLRDPDLGEGARAFAAVALGLVADKEPLPWNHKIAVNLNYRASPQTLVNPTFSTGILDIF